MTHEPAKQQALRQDTSLDQTDTPAVDAQPGPIDERVLLAARAADEKKAVDTVVLDLRNVASFTDYFVITSGLNSRQVQAIADEVADSLKRSGTRAARIEGHKTAEWVLLDYGDFVVHIFEDKARKFYDLERLWREARKVELPAAEGAGPDLPRPAL